MTAQRRTSAVSEATWPTHLRPVRFRRRSGVIRRRAAGWSVAFAVAALGVGVWSATTGSSGLSFSQVAGALFGQEDAGTVRILWEWRLPRIVFALLAGAALAMSGALFQSVTRNPLGSPDIIGFSTGSYTGALVVSVLVGTSGALTSAGALVGGFATGALVYFLAARQGRWGVTLIVVGVGVNFFLVAVNTWLLTAMRVEAALSAAAWGAGSLTDVGWEQVAVVAVSGVGAAAMIAPKVADLRLLELGDDLAGGLGVAAARARFVAVAAAIVLVAAVTACAGPIAFVALAAPQLAARITREPGLQLIPTATLGAVLVVASDLVARTIIAPAQLPVGVVTLAIGGTYLVWVLARSGRKVSHV